ncbi:uncharacterized protein LOC109849748 [Asparagus officinalis]|nr:uncharacterized protein LOC109849748 [Asparagus officinalis]
MSTEAPPPPPPSTESSIDGSDALRSPLISSPFLPLQKLQEVMPGLTSQYKIYEDAFVQKVKDGLLIVRENPAASGGIAVASGLLLMRGPRRFLFRNTLGRLQSEETKILKTEASLKELSQSVEKLKKESKNMILRTGFGEEELLRGRTKIRDAGHEIQRLSKSVYKIESQAADLMDGLRAMPGRSALKLRAEVASMASDLKQQRRDLNKKILKIAELGIRV